MSRHFHIIVVRNVMHSMLQSNSYGTAWKFLRKQWMTICYTFISSPSENGAKKRECARVCLPIEKTVIANWITRLQHIGKISGKQWYLLTRALTKSVALEMVKHAAAAAATPKTSVYSHPWRNLLAILFCTVIFMLILMILLLYCTHTSRVCRFLSLSFPLSLSPFLSFSLSSVGIYVVTFSGSKHIIENCIIMYKVYIPWCYRQV